MRTFMTDANPEFKLAIQELIALRAELTKLEQSNIPKLKGDGAEYIAKFRDFKYYETLLDLMAKQYEVARLDEAREGSVVQVIDPAYPPDRKSRPRKALIAVVTSIAVFLTAVIFVLLRRMMQDAMRSSEAGAKLDRLRTKLRFR